MLKIFQASSAQMSIKIVYPHLQWENSETCPISITVTIPEDVTLTPIKQNLLYPVQAFFVRPKVRRYLPQVRKGRGGFDPYVLEMPEAITGGR